MSEKLPARANLVYLKKVCKERVKELRAAGREATLAAVQREVARRYGFKSWAKLREHVQRQKVSPGEVELFLKAVAEGDFAAVGQQINRNPAIVHAIGKHPTWGGQPQSLHVAIERNRGEMLEHLLRAGADASGNNTGYDGWSPLMLAVHWKRAAMRDALIAAGARQGLMELLMLRDDAGVARMFAERPEILKDKVPNDGTPLHFARTAKAAELLLGAGVDAAVKDKYGKTALEAAVAVGEEARGAVAVLRVGGSMDALTLASMDDLAGLKALAKKDADALTQMKRGIAMGIRALHAATERGQTEVIRWLLAERVPVNGTVEHGVTPLHTAAWVGQLAAAMALVEAGADVQARDQEHQTTPSVWGRTAERMFGRTGSGAVALYLEAITRSRSDDPTIQALPEHRRTHKIAAWKPIMDAAFYGDAGRAKKLLKEGADPNVVSTTPAKYRPLHRAMEYKKTEPRTERHEACVRALLEGGADPHLRGGHDQLTALGTAAIGEVRFVETLRDKFLPLDIFHAAALADDARVAELLKKDPALAKAKDKNGWTSLHYVTQSAYCARGTDVAGGKKRLLAIARQLIDTGADASATYLWEEEWPIPVLYGCCGRHDFPELAELLIKAGASPCDGESVYHAADEAHEGVLAIIERLTPPKKLAKECSWALASVLHWGRTRGVKWFLEHGADPNILSERYGNSALHEAASRGSAEKIVALLLKHGADPKLKNKAGKTALQIAKAEGHDRVVKQLGG